MYVATESYVIVINRRRGLYWFYKREARGRVAPGLVWHPSTFWVMWLIRVAFKPTQVKHWPFEKWSRQQPFQSYDASWGWWTSLGSSSNL